MSEYPEVITPQVLEHNKSIPDTEILRDISDTEREIKLCQIALKGYEAEAQLVGMPHARMAQFRADGKRLDIKERTEFTNFLRRLLAARSQEPTK